MGHDRLGSERTLGPLKAWKFTASMAGAAVATGGLRVTPPGSWAGRLGRRIVRTPAVLAAVASVLFIPLLTGLGPYDSPSLRAAVETTITLVGLASAWLLYEQFARTRRLSDLLVFGAVVLLTLLNLFLRMLPAALDVDGTGQLVAGRMWGEMLVAASFAVAASVRPALLVVRPGRSVVILVVAGGAAIGTAIGVGVLISSDVIGPAGDHAALGAGPAGHPLGLALVLLAVGLLSTAAYRLSTGHDGSPDVSLTLVAAAAALLAAGSAYQLIVAPLGPGQVSLGEAPGLVASLLLMLAAWRYEPQSRERLVHAAALAERHRVAQDLHDGLAQDLALIAAHGSAIAEGMGDEHPIVVAAKRALLLSRTTISDLTDPAGLSSTDALNAVAQDLHARFGIDVAVDNQLAHDLPPDEREHVSRIAREAIANAARHGGARNVVVSLSRCENAVVLRVADDGCGLLQRKGRSPGEGFGVRSMRERAHLLGGYLTVHQPTHGGTELKVVFRSCCR